MYSQREYQQFCKKTKESWLAQCAVAVHKTLQNNPKDFADFAAQLQDNGWHTQVRGKNITFVNVNDKNKKVRANTIARKLNNDSLTAANIMRSCNAENWRDFTKTQKQKLQIKNQKSNTKSNAAATLKNIARRGNTTTKGGMRVRLHDIEKEYDL